MIRVLLPFHLRNLARVPGEVQVEPKQATLGAALDAIEELYPVLKGTIRDHETKKRRPFIRFFACKEDLSHEIYDFPLPQEIISGEEPLLVIGAIAGG